MDQAWLPGTNGDLLNDTEDERIRLERYRRQTRQEDAQGRRTESKQHGKAAETQETKMADVEASAEASRGGPWCAGGEMRGADSGV